MDHKRGEPKLKDGRGGGSASTPGEGILFALDTRRRNRNEKKEKEVQDQKEGGRMGGPPLGRRLLCAAGKKAR